MITQRRNGFRVRFFSPLIPPSLSVSGGWISLVNEVSTTPFI